MTSLLSGAAFLFWGYPSALQMLVIHGLVFSLLTSQKNTLASITKRDKMIRRVHHIQVIHSAKVKKQMQNSFISVELF